jgi:hypothetical protein
MDAPMRPRGVWRFRFKRQNTDKIQFSILAALSDFRSLGYS